MPIDPKQITAGFDPHVEFWAFVLLPSGEKRETNGHNSRAEAIEKLLEEIGGQK